MRTFRTVLAALICAIVSLFTMQAQNKYVGTKMCGMCHKSDKQGKQLDIWQKSKHAEAYKTLTTAKAAEFAKARGLKKPATESPECLECHTFGKTVDASLFEKGFDIKEGVQCESCHGPGSQYKNMTVMKDKAKSAAAGLLVYKDNVEIEKFCRSCHNEKSPAYKEFKFEEMWGKIKHAVPKV
ncbi:MAG: cytochrome [Bacteroidetes bacterium]|nr:cytochrome [Bacteroidota bacterium]